MGLNPYFANRYPARVLRRPAPAHRHRPRPRGRAGVHRVRRAGLRARRVDPGADHQPAGGPAGRVQPDVPVHRARPVGRAPHQRPRGRHVPGQHRRAVPTATRCTTTRCIPTPRRCSRRCRCQTRRSSAKRERIILHRRRAQPASAAEWLRVPHPLPDRHRRMPDPPAGLAKRRHSRQGALGLVPQGLIAATS